MVGSTRELLMGYDAEAIKPLGMPAKEGLKVQFSKLKKLPNPRRDISRAGSLAGGIEKALYSALMCLLLRLPDRSLSLTLSPNTH